MKKYQGFVFRSVPAFMVLLLSILAVGCGGSGQDPILGADRIAVLAPTVTAVVPLADTVGVPVNTKTVAATFSKPMDTSTLSTASFTLVCPGGTPIVGLVSYLAASNLVSLTLPEATSLAPNTLCKATVAASVKDTSGRPMSSNYVWTFTTGVTPDTTAPRVVATINGNGAVGVAINTKVGATFSEAMNPTTITARTFIFKQGATVVAGSLSYAGLHAVFTPTELLSANTSYNATVTTGAKDLAGNALVGDYVWSWTTGTTVDTAAPTVILVNPADLARNVAINSSINATFSKAMDPLTITSASFKVNGATGVISFNAASRIATFTPTVNLASGTTYTATVNTTAKDLSGNALAVDKAWSFTTVTVPGALPPINLRSVSSFGTFGGSAGMTNTGTLTVVNGNIGAIATGTSSISGFHDTAGDIYTETPANKGSVNGKIYTCANSITGPTSAGPNAASCAIATQARLDAQTAYLVLAAMPPGANPGTNLANLTLAPGVYTAPAGSFLIEGGNLTLDAQGNANAIWIFQMAQALTVGGPGAAFPQSIVLSGGAQAKNVYWQVGSFATVNAAGGGTMVGTIISQAGAAFSTAGNVAIVTLEGRVLSLGASVTVVDTVINVPSP